MDYLALGAFGVIGFLIGALTVTYTLYRLKKDLFFESILQNFIYSIVKDEELQKMVYQVGGLIGSGVKGGIGIDLPTKSRGGRFKWQDFVMELAGDFFKSTLTTQAQTSSFSPALPQTQKKVENDAFFKQ